MRISTVEAEVPVAERVTVTEDTLSVDLSDGRTISVPFGLVPTALARNTEGTTELAIDWQGLWYSLGRS